MSILTVIQMKHFIGNSSAILLLLALAGCLASCSERDEPIAVPEQDPAQETENEYSEVQNKTSESSICDHLNILNIDGTFLTEIKKRQRIINPNIDRPSPFSPSYYENDNTLMSVKYPEENPLLGADIFNAWGNCSMGMDINYFSPEMELTNNYLDCNHAEIEYAPNGCIGRIILYCEKHFTGHTNSYMESTTYTYDFNYDSENHLIEYDTYMDYRDASSDYGGGGSSHQGSSHTKTTLTWANGNLLGVQNKKIFNNIIIESSTPAEIAIYYNEDEENESRQYCVAVVRKIINRDVLCPFAMIGLFGKGPRNVPVKITTNDETKDIELGYTGGNGACWDSMRIV